MALRRDVRYPGRFQATSTNYPQGAFKNRSAPTAQDGSYLESDWANDWDGFFARMLNVAGMTPNNVRDTGLESQLFNALRALTLQRGNPFGDIKTDNAVATGLSNLGLGATTNYANLGNGYRLMWVKGTVPGGVLAATSAVSVSLTFASAFTGQPFVYWPAVSTPQGVTAGAGVVATCANLTTTGMDILLYNASNAQKQITAVIGFSIGQA